MQARNPHKVRLDLEGPEALEEAIALARKAYDEAGRAVARSASDPDAAWSPAPEYEELFERLRAGIADLGRDIEELPRVNYFVFSSGKRFAVVRQRKDHLFLNVALTHPFDDSEQLVSVEGTPTGSQRDLWLHSIRLTSETNLEAVVDIVRQAYERTRSL